MKKSAERLIDSGEVIEEKLINKEKGSGRQEEGMASVLW